MVQLPRSQCNLNLTCFYCYFVNFRNYEMPIEDVHRNMIMVTYISYGIIANILMVIAILRNKELRNQTGLIFWVFLNIRNFFSYWFIISLAFCDIITISISLSRIVVWYCFPVPYTVSHFMVILLINGIAIFSSIEKWKITSIPWNVHFFLSPFHDIIIF